MNIKTTEKINHFNLEALIKLNKTVIKLDKDLTPLKPLLQLNTFLGNFFSSLDILNYSIKYESRESTADTLMYYTLYTFYIHSKIYSPALVEQESLQSVVVNIAVKDVFHLLIIKPVEPPGLNETKMKKYKIEVIKYRHLDTRRYDIFQKYAVSFDIRHTFGTGERKFSMSYVCKTETKHADTTSS
ncbi:hypothetical protein AGLY_017647 [Aphis glycines]|uniref:Uncharacterized protein n=1 Tax=Aphis glycines TaxID=307491 RepID=A0A6G0SV28_APHGL|nr:hypothetical protein AGLY_017647 [Aphis glycines]